MNDRHISRNATVGIVFALVVGCSSSPGAAGSSSDAVGGQCATVSGAICQRLVVDCAPQTPSDGPSSTVQDECNALADPICAHMVQCGATASEEACKPELVKGCCVSAEMCALPALVDDAAMQSCQSAAATWDCSLALAGQPPPQCARVVRPAPSQAAVAACTDALRPGCCDNAGVCDRSATSTAADIDACVSALRGADCGALEAGQIPIECQHVVKYASAAHLLKLVPAIEAR